MRIRQPQNTKTPLHEPGEKISRPFQVRNDLSAVVVPGVAIAAVYRTITAGLEGHLGGGAALIADHVIHLTIATVVGHAAVGTAARAAARLVLEAFFGVEGLFGGREDEFCATLAAHQGFVGIHYDCILLFDLSKPDQCTVASMVAAHQLPDAGRNLEESLKTGGLALAQYTTCVDNCKDEYENNSIKVFSCGMLGQ
jgi:hypothetical protein